MHMHYGDEEWEKENRLKVVIYKHEILNKEGEFEYDICSIQECKYIPLHSLEKFQHTFQYLFPTILKGLEKEKFYLMTVYMDRSFKFGMCEIEDVTDSEDKFLRLH